jgi:phosphate transport system permease protein
MPGNSSLKRSSLSTTRRLFNAGERALWRGLAISFLILPLVMGGGLFLSARGILTERTLADLFSPGAWNPARGQFTYLPFMAGTLWVTLLAVVIALPLSLAVAVYTSEYAPKRFGALLKPVVDVIAGLPSVIFGLWGVILIVPLVRDVLAPLGGASSTGYTVLTAALVLAIMIMPIMVQIAMEVFGAVPLSLRQAAYALGATRLEVVNRVVLRKSLPGLVAAVVLALARAFGETLAVMMVVGGIPAVPTGPLSPAATLPTLVANGYGEMSSIPLYHQALMGAAFILFLVVVGFTLVSHVVLARVKRSME